MSEKIKATNRDADFARKAGSRRLTAIADIGEEKRADVRYFLRILGQISTALNMLGYCAEGLTLAQVERDLKERIFGSATGPISAPSELN